MNGPYIAASVGLGILVFLLLLAVAGALYLRRNLKALNRRSTPGRKFGTFITPKQPPEFQIPPYMLITEESGDETETMSEIGDKQTEEITATLSAAPVGRSLSFPSDSRGMKRGRAESDDSEATGISTKEYRPQYRRAISQFATSAQTKKATPRKVSVAPYGKLEVSVQFVSVKNLLFVQVNGAFDLPQVRLSGVSTPYVRVHLLSADHRKEPRSCFINLGTNRICVFDQITLEEAQRSTLKFVVLDYDKFSRSEFVAEVMLTLLEIDLVEGTTVSRNLNSKAISESRDCGSLTVSLCQQPTAGQLTVIVMKAEGLPLFKPDVTGGLDTFVKVAYYVQGKVMEKKKTKVVKKSVSPVFNEVFVFDIMEEDLKHSSIMCEIYRGDTVLKTERIGRIVLGLDSFGSEIRHWNEMRMSPQKRVTETHLLHT